MQEGLTGHEAERFGRDAHPLRVLPLQQYLHLEISGGRIAGNTLTQLEVEVLVLCTGRSSCDAIFRRLHTAGKLSIYEELRQILDRLEKDFLIVYSHEMEEKADE